MAYPVRVSMPKNMAVSSDGFIKHVEFHGEHETDYYFTYKKLEKTMLFEYLRQNETLCHENVMTVTFKTSTFSYCVDVLNRGIFCEGKQYRFLGYSESQITEKTCYMMHISKRGMSNLLSTFGDFSEITDLRMRARRVGLLFATFDNLVEVSEDEVAVRTDVKSRFKRHIFTSGCGFMYPQFHSKLRSQLPWALYPEPSAVLVRYQGFEGMLVLKEGPHTNDCHQVYFHESMQKFVIQDAVRDAISFICTVDYSKPHENGYLDNLLIMLLISRGVSVEYIINLQKEYYGLLKAMCKDESSESYFLRLTGRSNSLNENLTALRREEINKMFDYVDDPEHERSGNRVPRTHILVPKSRVVFGVCDPYGELKYNECYFKPTLLHDESQVFADENKVIVACIPCYHPGDIRVLTLTHEKSRYGNLTDCLVLPVKGPRSHAFECGGRNLDGSKFFVSWDACLIPKENVKPCSYLPTTRERIAEAWAKVFRRLSRSSPKSKKESREEMIDHFARFAENLPKQIDENYRKFVRALGPSSEECELLSKMFYQATHLTVDAAVLREKLVEEFENKDPARPKASSGDQLPTERSSLLEEEDEGTVPFRYLNPGRNSDGFFHRLFDRLSCRHHGKPFAGINYEALWDAFNEQTANFVEEMHQGQDFH